MVIECQSRKKFNNNHSRIVKKNYLLREKKYLSIQTIDCVGRIYGTAGTIVTGEESFSKTLTFDSNTFVDFIEQSVLINGLATFYFIKTYMSASGQSTKNFFRVVHPSVLSHKAEGHSLKVKKIPLLIHTHLKIRPNMLRYVPIFQRKRKRGLKKRLRYMFVKICDQLKRLHEIDCILSVHRCCCSFP